jgi:hypothetical protein
LKGWADRLVDFIGNGSRDGGRILGSKNVRTKQMKFGLGALVKAEIEIRFHVGPNEAGKEYYSQQNKGKKEHQTEVIEDFVLWFHFL